MALTNCDMPFECGLLLIGESLDPDEARRRLPLRTLGARRRNNAEIDSTRFLGLIGRAQTARDIDSVLRAGLTALLPHHDFLQELRTAGVSTRVNIDHPICHGYALVIIAADVLAAMGNLGLELRCEWMVNRKYLEESFGPDRSSGG